MYVHDPFYIYKSRKQTKGHKQCTIRLVIADGHLISLRGVCEYAWVNTVTITLKGLMQRFRNFYWF